MASGDIIEFMKVWYMKDDPESEALVVKSLQKGLDIVVQEAGDGDFLSRISKGKEISRPTTSWLEEEQYPHDMTAQLTGSDPYTLTFSGKIFGENISADSIKQVIRVGTVLERESDNVVVEVTDVTGLATTPWDCTVVKRGWDALSEDSGGVIWNIIGEETTDYYATVRPRALDRFHWEVGTQIWREDIEMPQTRLHTKYEEVSNEFQHGLSALQHKMRVHLARTVLRGTPHLNISNEAVYGDKVEQSAMCGLYSWARLAYAKHANANVYKNLSGAELTKDHLDDLVEAMWLETHCKFDTGNWGILVGPALYNQIMDWDSDYRRTQPDTKRVGFKNETILTKTGPELPIIRDRNARKTYLAVVNFDKFEYGYYAGDTMWRKELATYGRFQQWMMTYQTYGLICRIPRQIGIIYGCDV